MGNSCHQVLWQCDSRYLAMRMSVLSVNMTEWGCSVHFYWNTFPSWTRNQWRTGDVGDEPIPGGRSESWHWIRVGSNTHRVLSGPLFTLKVHLHTYTHYTTQVHCLNYRTRNQSSLPGQKHVKNMKVSEKEIWKFPGVGRCCLWNGRRNCFDKRKK